MKEFNLEEKKGGNKGIPFPLGRASPPGGAHCPAKTLFKRKRGRQKNLNQAARNTGEQTESCAPSGGFSSFLGEGKKSGNLGLEMVHAGQRVGRVKGGRGGGE